jgi:hypothetical protein
VHTFTSKRIALASAIEIFYHHAVMSGEKIIIVPDTNALYSKKAFLSGEFLQDLTEVKKLRKVQLVVPKVVFDERNFQLVAIAQQHLQDGAKAYERLRKMFEINVGGFAPPENIRDTVATKLNSALADAGGTIIPIPLESIDWNRLIENSVWRNPPFSKQSKETATASDNQEKGFRDALYVETVLSFARQSAAILTLAISDKKSISERYVREIPARLNES